MNERVVESRGIVQFTIHWCDAFIRVNLHLFQQISDLYVRAIDGFECILYIETNDVLSGSLVKLKIRDSLEAQQYDTITALSPKPFAVADPLVLLLYAMLAWCQQKSTMSNQAVGNDTI